MTVHRYLPRRRGYGAQAGHGAISRGSSGLRDAVV